MKTTFVALIVALAAGPIAAQAHNDPTAPTRTGYGLGASSWVLTPQGVRSQLPAVAIGQYSSPKPDAGRQASWPARATLMDLIASIACTSMFALPPDSLGTDPAASAGR